MVENIIPTEDGVYKWYLKSEDREIGYRLDESEYALLFEYTLSFEEAKAYKKKYGEYIRKNQWTDMKIEVYIKI